VVRIARSGPARVPIRLTPAQLRAVRLGRRLRVRVEMRFLPARGPLASTSAVVAFGRARAARGHIAAALAR
jgi:hypothetical protein